MSSCLGFRKRDHSDTEPLLPQYEQNTELQRKLNEKLHTYQMLRALSRGFLPSNEQTIINLRTLLSKDFFQAQNPDLSASGHRLVTNARLWITQFIELLQHKNERDQIQDAIWFLTKSRISVDVGDIARKAQKTKAKADASAAYQSLKTVGSLLLTNSDFRVFLSDLNVVGREVFRDSAFALSNVAEEAGKKVGAESGEQNGTNAVAKHDAAAKKEVPTANELGEGALDVSTVVADSTLEVAKTAKESASDKLSGEEGDVLINRLKQAVLSLRKRPDYKTSVSTLSLLIQRYAMVYSRAALEIGEVAQEDIQENESLDRAARNTWSLITSFGDREAWTECEKSFQQILSHRDNDPQFEEMMKDVAESFQKLLTDPDFFENAQQKLQELRAKGEKVGSESDLNKDVQKFFQSAEGALKSVLDDEDVNKLIRTSLRLFDVLSPTGENTNSDLIQDAINVFVPLIISAIQYIPIPRLEISTPEIDLLLENLILEPGTTVNHSSFLPFRLKVETYNDLEITKARFRTVSHSKHLMTIKLDGLSIKASEVGFWFRAHKGLLRLADQGLATFALDQRGVDIHIDVEIARERLEQILTLRDVRVHIHKLSYKVRQSKFSFLGWLLQPLLRPVIRKTMEHQLSSALKDFFHAANRELLFARERLRATRIADPNDLLTFFRAIAARLTPEDDPDVNVRLGVDQPGKGVFRGVYAPGSVVKVWHEEALQAAERIDEFDAGGWRNEIFDTHVAHMT